MDCHFEQRATNKEMDNAFALLNKYVKAKNGGTLVLVDTGSNTYVLGIRSKGSSGYSTIGSHLTKKEMIDTLWDMTKILSELRYGNLEFRD